MRIAIAGGHGTIALELTRLLSADGDEVRSLIRNPDHADDVRTAGGEPVVADLEADDAETLAAAVGDVDAVVFAAGAGPGSGPARKMTVDYEAAVKVLEAARRRGVRRYLVVSSVGADADHPGDEVFDVYLRAKGRADAEIAAAGVDHTVVRPVSLTDDPPTGHVRVGDVERGATVSRADVAAVLVACLRDPASVGATFVLAAGDVPVAEAVAGLG
jgi:uncharacterized protein YbjT (DUF2867 family)